MDESSEFTTLGKVCYRDVDAHGWVNHSEYLRICIDAMQRWLVERDISLKALKAEDGIVIHEKAAKVNWVKGSKMEDQIAVRTSVEIIDDMYIEFSHEVLCNGELACKVTKTLFCANEQTGEMVPIPDEVTEKLEHSQPKPKANERNFSNDVLRGVVSHRNVGNERMGADQFLDVCEDARYRFFLNRGLSQVDLENEDDTIFAAIAAEVKMTKAAELEGEISVTTSVKNIGGKSMAFYHEVYCNGERVCEINITLVSVSKESERPITVSEKIRDRLENGLSKEPVDEVDSREPMPHGSALIFQL